MRLGTRFEVSLGNLRLEKAGELLNLSWATAYRTWTYAKTFLKATLSD